MAVYSIERTSPSPQDSESEDQLSLSSRDGFVCREGCVFSLSPRPGVSMGKYGAMPLRIMSHLKKVIKLMRPQDSLKLAVELEKSSRRQITRYMSLITTLGLQDTEESIILGTEQDEHRVDVCLVLPLLRDTEIKLNGDGGFSVHSYDKQYNFKPCSVQSMWTVLQSMFKAIEQARTHNYFVGGLSHTWITYYTAQLTDDGVLLNEWNVNADISSFRPDSPIYFDVNNGSETGILNPEKENFRRFLVSTLRDIMLHCDLEQVTSKQLRLQLEEELKMDLKEYKSYLDQQMLVILGQMEKPSKIHEYLYLGSEWNAADLTGLQDLGIGYILNVTKEIDNFYPENFKYKAIRLYDVPQSELLMHWESTYNFIKEAKEANSKVLVHCKMGISRSAATTIAYTMKEYRMSLVEAFRHVKSCRNIINPNHGFMTQLQSYEGILTARYNQLFGCLVPSRLTFQSRSNSDSNIRMKLFTDSSTGCKKDDQTPPTEGVENPVSVDCALENQVASSLPPEKVPVMVNYLASLPVSEGEDDLGIMVPSPSDSGSPFSSPLLTPPDIEGMQLMLREFQEAEKDRLEREKESCSEGKDLLSIPSQGHARVGRAVSLPTSNTTPHPLSTEVYPRNAPITYTGPSEGNDLRNEEIPEGEVKITLTQSVNERVREIEKKNVVSVRGDRPASAGSRKYHSGGLSLASSEDSLFNTKRVSGQTVDENGIKTSQMSNVSPISSSIPERQDGCDSINDAVSPNPTLDTTGDTTVDGYSTMTTPPLPPTSDQGMSSLRAVRSESPPPSSCSSTGLCLTMDQDTGDIDIMLADDKMEGKIEGDTDPATAYRVAQKRSLLLSEKKNRLRNQNIQNTSDDESVSKGVKQLQAVFGGERSKRGLKRTQSLKEEIRPVFVHRRTPSVATISLDTNTT